MERLVLLPVNAGASQVSCWAFSEADIITPGALLSCNSSPHTPLSSPSGRRLAERAMWLLGTASLTAFPEHLLYPRVLKTVCLQD